MKKLEKGTKEKIVSILLSVVMAVCVIVPKLDMSVSAVETDAGTNEVLETESGIEQEDSIICAGDVYTYEENDYSVTYVIENAWEGNYTARIEITNKKDVSIENWMISFLCKDEISNIYNATIVEHTEDLYQIKNVEYNQDIPANGMVSFGFMVTYDEVADIPHPYIVLSEDTAVESTDYMVEFNVTNAWDGGYIGEIIITNNGSDTIEDWYLACETEDEIVNIWNATLDLEAEEYDVIRAANYQQNIHADESYVIGFQAVGNVQDLTIHGLYELKYTEKENNSDTDKEKEDSSDLEGEVGGNTDEDKDNNMDAAITEYDVIVYTDAFRAADMENTYYVEDALYELSGELVGYENVKKMEYVLTDVNGYILSEGTVFDSDEGKQPMERWDISDFGLAIGCNILNFKLTLKDDTIIEEGFTFIDLYGMNMERVDVDLSDTDGDGLNNYFESVLHTNPQLKDTDEDTLSDYDEFILFGTDPTLADSDGNGVRDSKEDYDGDGLNTIEEKAYGTNIALIDSDYDGVDDGIEVRQLSSNPTVEDTDGDGLLDGEEYSMGLSPIWPDTDGDDVLDCDEVILQTTSIAFEEVTCVEKIDVTLECAGAIQNEVYIENMTGRNSLSCDVVGLIGAPINIHTDVDFDKAKITFHYEPAELGNIMEENLSVLWYDEANNQFVVMDNVFVDTEHNTVTCITTHFSEYMLVDKEEWYSVWMRASEYVPVYEPCDIAIMSDSTASVFHYWTKGYGLINYPNGYIAGENVIYGYFNIEGGYTRSGWVQNDEQYIDALNNIFYYHFYSTGSTERDGRNGKYGDGFVELVEMFSNSYYEILHSDNPKVALFTYDGYLLETEEQNQKVKDSVEKLKRMGVTIYAVSETDKACAIIENAAIETGGKHYNVCSHAETEKIWSMIHEEMSDLDKDTDEDGLPDVYEINGMRVPNGRVIKTDPNNPDSDGDERTDGEEMGELVDIVVEVDGEGTKKTFQVYKWVSDPNVAVTLSGDFIFVDYIDESNNLDGFCKMEYMPYSIDLYDNWYVKSIDYEYYNNENRAQVCQVNGVAGIHGCVPYNARPTEKLYSYYQAINTGLIYACVAFVAGTSGEFSCTDCYRRYIYGTGGDYIGLSGETTRHYINADFIVENKFMNNGYTNYIDNMSKCMQEAENLLSQDDESDFYFATSPNVTWRGCSYWTNGELVESLGTMGLNIPALGVFNTASAAVVAHCSYNDDTQKICMEFKYVIMDYYDFSFWEELYELDAYGYAQSYELYGVYYGYIEWDVNDNYEDILKVSKWSNEINTAYNDCLFYPSNPRKVFN